MANYKKILRNLSFLVIPIIAIIVLATNRTSINVATKDNEATINDYDLEFSIPDSERFFENFKTLQSFQKSKDLRKKLVTKVKENPLLLSDFVIIYKKIAINKNSKSIDLYYLLKHNKVLSKEKKFTINNFLTKNTEPQFELTEKLLNQLNLQFTISEDDKFIEDFNSVDNWNNNSKISRTLVSDNQELLKKVTLNSLRVNITKVEIIDNNIKVSYTLAKETLVSALKSFTVSGFKSKNASLLTKLNAVNMTFRRTGTSNLVDRYLDKTLWTNPNSDLTSFAFSANDFANLSFEISSISTNKLSDDLELIITYIVKTEIDKQIFSSDAKTFSISGFVTNDSIRENQLQNSSVTFTISSQSEKIYENFNTVTKFNNNSNISKTFNTTLDQNELTLNVLSFRKSAESSVFDLIITYTLEIAKKDSEGVFSVSKEAAISNFKTEASFLEDQLNNSSVALALAPADKIYENFDTPQKWNASDKLTKNISSSLDSSAITLNFTKVKKVGDTSPFSLVLSYTLTSAKKATSGTVSVTKELTLSGFKKQDTILQEKLNASRATFNLAAADKIFENFNTAAKWNQSSRVASTFTTTLEPSKLQLNVINVSKADSADTFSVNLTYTLSLSNSAGTDRLSVTKTTSIAGFKTQSDIVRNIKNSLNNSSATFSIPELQRIWEDFDQLENWKNNDLVTVRYQKDEQSQEQITNLRYKITKLVTLRGQGTIRLIYQLQADNPFDSATALESEEKAFDVTEFVDPVIITYLTLQSVTIATQGINLPFSLYEGIKNEIENNVPKKGEYDQEYGNRIAQLLKSVFAQRTNLIIKDTDPAFLLNPSVALPMRRQTGVAITDPDSNGIRKWPITLDFLVSVRTIKNNKIEITETNQGLILTFNFATR